MIRYTLLCDSAHEFESWFPDSAGFEKLSQRGLVTCPACGSAKVERAIMAPAVARTDRERSAPAAPVPAAPQRPANAPAPAALIGERETQLREMIAALHRHVAENSEHVGPRFAEVALKIHYGESENRLIHGQASAEDARMLHEEGVDFLPLPRLPDTGN